MKKVDNLFPVLFAAAGILFVVWGISAGAAVSESISPEAKPTAAMAPAQPAVGNSDKSERRLYDSNHRLR